MSKHKLGFVSLAAAILCVILTAATGAAQTTSGTLMGTVKDQTESVLPGVSLTITNTDTGAVRETVTDDAGRYSVPQLVLGDYQIEASLEGFQTGVRSGIKLTVGREAVIDFSPLGLIPLWAQSQRGFLVLEGANLTDQGRSDLPSRTSPPT